MRQAARGFYQNFQMGIGIRASQRLKATGFTESTVGVISGAKKAAHLGILPQYRNVKFLPGGKEASGRVSGIANFEEWLLKKIYYGAGQAPIRLARRGGAEFVCPDRTPVASVIFDDWSTLAKLALNPEVGFGEGYTEGKIQVEGDLLRLVEEVYRARKEKNPDGFLARSFSRWLRFIQDNSLRGSRKNIHRHYDLSTDFYKLWLDSQLVYTCAYFPSPAATLEEAQVAKMDLVCRKLRLQPGEKVVEAGCGWGSFALHMARNYGANVRAFNISREQIQFARERAKKEGLHGQVEFVEDDYRNISGGYDIFVSIGMLEHVGAKHYGEFQRVIHRTMGNAGRGLLHFIGRNQPRPFSAWIRKRIFPGAYAPALREALAIVEPLDIAVLDVENLRLHYALTLQHWLARYEQSLDRVIAMYGEEFSRAWRLYLAGSMAGFRVGGLQLFQVLFAGPACRQIPWTRAHLYTEEHTPAKDTRWISAMS
jgi:cyclopropane-fatty-acyl-phospholipid synthase